MNDNIKEKEDEEEKQVDEITRQISDKLIEKTTALVEEKKQDCQKIIDLLKAESAITMASLDSAVQKLQILYEGNEEKTNTLNKNYHEALANITIINAKLETLSHELENKLRTVEKGFLKLFEEDEKSKSAIVKTTGDLNTSKKQLNFIIQKLFGTPYDSDEENKKSFVYRIVKLEDANKKKRDEIDGLKKTIEALQIEIKTLHVRLDDIESQTIVYFLEKGMKPIRKVLNDLAVVIAKSIMIKLLIMIAIGLGIFAEFEDYIIELIKELF